MLQKYSWSEYWLVVVVGIAIYYAVVFFLLFRNGLLKPPTLKRPAPTQSPASKPLPVAAAETKPVAKVSKEKEVELQLKSLIEDVTNFLQDIAGKSYVKEEIIMGLQVFMCDYKEFADTAHQPDINEFIVAEVDNYCSVDLTSEEVSRVWLS
jgi:hypothetical protein